MKSYSNCFWGVLVWIIFCSCRPVNIDLTEEEVKDEDDIGNIVDLNKPTVRTAEVMIISSRETKLSGHISDDNGSAVTERGFVWGRSPQPALGSANKIIEGKGVGSFSSILTNLQQTLTFYCRAFATNDAGTSYGNEVSFTLEAEPQANMNLNGKWLSSSGSGVEISGATGRFYVYGSSWQAAEAKALVKIGDVKFKNISKVSANKWTFIELGIKRTNQIPVAAVWSYDGTISISADGKSITTASNTMIDGVSQYATQTYVRQ